MKASSSLTKAAITPADNHEDAMTMTTTTTIAAEVERVESDSTDHDISDEDDDDNEDFVADLILDIPKIVERFDVIEKVGDGTFSSVFKARLRVAKDILPAYVLTEDPNLEYVALKKMLANSSPKRIMTEVRLLHELGGRCNVPRILSTLRHFDCQVIVMEYFEHNHFKEYVSVLTLEEIRRYMAALLSTLCYLAKNRIVHRDVKPSNFLHCRSRGTYRLVDFGLAQTMDNIELSKEKTLKAVQKRVFPRCLAAGDKEFKVFTTDRVPNGVFEKDPRPRACAPRAGTRGFRAPEVLVRHRDQGPPVDVWSSGVIFLSLLTGRYPIFMSLDDISALYEIWQFVGGKHLKNAMADIGVVLTSDLEVTERLSWRSLCEELRVLPAENEDIATDYKQGITVLPLHAPNSAYSLLQSLLNCHPSRRLTALEALEHSFFKTEN